MEESEAARLHPLPAAVSGMEERIRRLRHLFDRHYPGIVAVYLYKPVFGPGPFADIDLGILLAATPEATHAAEAEVEWMIQNAMGLEADVRILNGGPPTFVGQVIRGGRLIVDRDAAFRKSLSEEILHPHAKEPRRPVIGGI
ncbi:MAG: hypothetical protein K9K88_17605 [Desulfobacterales bacterium]|nr:hypothetical protein [Desulfobacterales bacterium]